MTDAVERLIRPRSIAIVGASPDTGKLTGRPFAYLKKHGYQGRIYPVNPRYKTIGDDACYPDVASLPTPPDVGLVLLGSERVTEAVSELSKRGARAAIVLASGFGESGPEGRARQAKLKEAAGPMRLLGPNTIGLVNVTDGIMLSASAALELEGISAGNGIAERRHSRFRPVPRGRKGNRVFAFDRDGQRIRSWRFGIH